MMSLFLFTWEDHGEKRETRSNWKGGIHYKKADIHQISVQIIGNTAILLNRITVLAVVGDNEVTNPFIVTEVYIKKRKSGDWDRFRLPE